MDRKRDNVLLGGLYIVLAAIAYACMGALVKLGGKISDPQLVFFRNFVCLIVLLPLVLFPKPKPLHTKFFTTHFIRSIAGLLNMYAFFLSLRYIILTDAMLLNNTMPLFVPLVVWVWKGQKLSFKQIPALIIGFIGIILVLRPGLGIFRPAALFALASGIFMSISMAGIRELGKLEPVYRILFYYFALTTLVSAIPLFWTWGNHSPFLWLVLAGVGVFAAMYQFMLTLGYQYAEATKISPLIYFAVILSGVFDWAFWNVIPGLLSYIGVVLVIIGAIWSLRAHPRR
jgi:drug/metabolite transporter (DMT)-like permease